MPNTSLYKSLLSDRSEKSNLSDFHCNFKSVEQMRLEKESISMPKQTAVNSHLSLL